MKKIVFLTGTRADFGKIKSLIQILESNNKFEVFLFVTGMHLQKEYGYTLIEVQRCNFKNIHTFQNHTSETTMDLTLAKTINGFSKYIKEIEPDMIIVHGDRVEALAGAIVGSLNNILVAHIEGGELSGTIDELIRHSISKLSHIHFVANKTAKKRLLQMGELEKSVYIIGSPDLDIMFSENLPNLSEVKAYYQIPFNEYAIVMFHPVTTEIDDMDNYASNFVNSLLAVNHNFVVIYPNNDLGSKIILKHYRQLNNNSRFKIFPSLKFEYFLTLLKKASFLIGNSSAGVREAPYYNLPSINIGTRQNNRVTHTSIINVSYDTDEITNAITKLNTNFQPENKKFSDFGNGNSAELFLDSLQEENIWQLNHQKQFKDF
ncbi:MAG: UDP-N-acetylglucosamine 2-epimerase (hydrolyzing) [Bacteroidetes bacterium]|nr:UDP-N-acetylglucosamine 2-epimerase (hydrolyzing) [Bacteroidota bacterium]